ncbi:MAG: valine--tRNA ligase [Deltaproteobacteria bacterium]|jgi:valyl-tRNA synthetase|nr:valine--tRNA ligase [Deltaproteobacteria bacterium]
MCPRDPLDKNFNFAEAEPRIYGAWETNGLFVADPDRAGQSFVIVIPPPNVTGNLHMGHALDVTLQDILTRYHRMLGDNALWLPGTDHAGIATQNVVERALLAEGTSREELGREKFIERVWEWKKTYGGNIVRQLRRLGASCDWSRERFTMDEGLSKAVREVFVSLHEDGLIYQGEYIINWCPRCHTAVSDIEVEHENRLDSLYYLKYEAYCLPPLVVATTRPETCFGDTAVAVNPADPRYEMYRDREVKVPLTDRAVPVILDDYVDLEFGTGALKVTPAHDPNDFLIGRRHNLGRIVAIDESGRLTKATGPYEGMDRDAARGKILDDLTAKGLLEKVEPLSHAVGVCYRCRTVIEPLVSKQWFVNTAPLAEAAAQAVRDGRTKMVPANWEKTYFDWMDNIRDWCVSRQLWWGHQIPAWHCQNCGQTTVARVDPDKCPHCQSLDIKRDPDVLDTWFSSGLWPFSTLGWPEKTKDLARYYPTSVLVTGFDIIFFWVARMMMLGLKTMGEVPFHTVVLHPLVRDAQGQKMSKSKGNVMDPLEILDRLGADSFRFALASQAGQARDLKLDVRRVEGYSKFVNKIWNAARLTLSAASQKDRPEGDRPEGEGPEPAGQAGPERPTALPDRWIRSRLREVADICRASLDGYHFDRYCEILYQFTWYEFCDWYLELIKPILYGQDEKARRETYGWLNLTFRDLLKLLHPVMPFVTEELWPKISGQSGYLMVEPFPGGTIEAGGQATGLWDDPEAEKLIRCLMDVTRAVRQARSDFGLNPAIKLSPVVLTGDPAIGALLADQGQLLLKLMGAEKLSLATDKSERPKDSALNVLDWGQVWTPLAGLIDPKAEEARLSKEAQKLGKDIAAAENKLANPDYLKKAPEDVVAETGERLTSMGIRLAEVERALAVVKNLG